MDISLFDTKSLSDSGSWLDIVDFDFVTPIGCSILVLGPDSDPAVKIADEEEKATQQRMFDSFSGKKTAEDEETRTEKDIRKAVRITKDWKDIEWDGAEFPYSEANAEKLYRYVPHIRMQVLTYYSNRLNFTQPGYASWKKPSGQVSSSTTRAKKAR